MWPRMSKRMILLTKLSDKKFIDVTKVALVIPTTKVERDQQDSIDILFDGGMWETFYGSDMEKILRLVDFSSENPPKKLKLPKTGVELKRG